MTTIELVDSPDEYLYCRVCGDEDVPDNFSVYDNGTLHLCAECDDLGKRMKEAFAQLEKNIRERKSLEEHVSLVLSLFKRQKKP
jgi:ribosome-binding protein aMBF1 (putative translation factor)